MLQNAFPDNKKSDNRDLNSTSKNNSGIIDMTQLEDFNQQIYEQFSSLLEKKKLTNQLNDSVSVQEFIAESERLNIIEKAPFYVAKFLFTEQIVKEIEAYRMLLYQLCKKHMTRQRSLLIGIEMIIDENSELQEKLLNTGCISRIFYELYQKDIVTEEVFCHWHEQNATEIINETISTKIRDCAENFVEWLHSAEEGSDEDDNRSK
ncbi:unnamed protein product [Adineta steineri]|uniref:W2 domain-containing protein n=1 Tax=Adineta steineri TaxID=433720 RepID=A0A814L4U7_9BILA|nr:unnamed protein product [Adineta steineri]CAF1077260.1 unnamed protein product [Adineta steineri]CAF1236053.1 unnamed protein product [Adineta steineri]CAF3558907.1 unnamed protein product [Adineta steineri]CAF3849299.1 unnamed protein product [Adineta steineri]